MGPVVSERKERKRFAGEAGKWGRGVSECGLGGLGFFLRARGKEGMAWWAGLVCSPAEFFFFEIKPFQIFLPPNNQN